MQNEAQRAYDNLKNKNQTTIDPKLPTPFTCVAGARENVAALVNRIETLVDELLGAAPQEAQSDIASMPGRLGEVYNHADAISDLTSRAHRALDRLKKVMG
jgi:hypothetical protein